MSESINNSWAFIYHLMMWLKRGVFDHGYTGFSDSLYALKKRIINKMYSILKLWCNFLIID